MEQVGGKWQGADGNWYDNESDANLAIGYSGKSSSSSSNELGGALIGGMKAAGDWLGNKAEENRERGANQWAIRQSECVYFLNTADVVYNLYNAGKIDEAIEQCLRKGGSDEYKLMHNLRNVIPVMLYKSGRYEEAALQKNNFIKALCYDKLGKDNDATKMLNYAFKNIQYKIPSDARKFLGTKVIKTVLSAIPDYIKVDYVEDLREDRLVCEMRIDIDFSEIVDLVKKKVNEGNPAVYNIMADLCKNSIVAGYDENKIKEWKEKAKEFKENNIQQKVDELQKKMDSGDKDAFFTVAENYYEGKNGYKKNRRLAYKNMKEAKKLGHEKARWRLPIYRMCLFGFNDYADFDLTDDAGFAIISGILFAIALATFRLCIRADFPVIPPYSSPSVYIFIGLSLLFGYAYILCVKWKHTIITILGSLFIIVWIIGLFNLFGSSGNKFLPTFIYNIVSNFIK